MLENDLFTDNGLKKFNKLFWHDIILQNIRKRCSSGNQKTDIISTYTSPGIKPIAYPASKHIHMQETKKTREILSKENRQKNNRDKINKLCPLYNVLESVVYSSHRSSGCLQLYSEYCITSKNAKSETAE